MEDRLTITEALQVARRQVTMGPMNGQYVVQETPCGGDTAYETGPFDYHKARKAVSADRAAMAVRLMGGGIELQREAEDIVWDKGGRWEDAVRACRARLA